MLFKIMGRIVKFKDFVIEALGVPTGIIPLAKELYEYIIQNIDSDDNLTELEEKKIVLEGNFNINDMSVKKIEISFKFKQVEDDEGVLELLGMSSYFDNTIGVTKKRTVPYALTGLKDELKISVNFAASDDILGDDIKHLFISDKNYLIPVLAHELKHFYDKFKKKRQVVPVWSEYAVVSKVNFGSIKPLNDFLFLSYYLHEFENLVRPTELAAMIDVEQITPDKFKEFFMNTEIYRLLKMGQEFSLKNLRKELNNYILQILGTLVEIGYEPIHLYFMKNQDNGDDEIVELILKEFYEHILTWRGSFLKMILFDGEPHPLRFIGKKDQYLDDYYQKIVKFGSDYDKFYEKEEKFLQSEATRMIKKLSGLYAITDIYKKK